MKKIKDYFKSNEEKGMLFNLLYSFFLIPMFITIGMFYAYGWLNHVTTLTFSIKTVIFSFVIINFLNIILLFITKNTVRSIFIIGLTIFIFLIVDQVKIKYMGMPLFVSDLNFLQNYSNIASFTGSSLLKIILELFVRSLPIILFFIGLLFLAWKFKIEVERKKVRLVSLGILIILVLLLYPFSWTRKFYLNYIYTDINRNDLREYLSYKILYGYYGLIGGMHFQYLNSLIDYENPDDYDKDKLQKLEDTSRGGETSIGTPNVIVILSESFFDVEKLKKDITFNKTVTGNYRKLKDEGSYINLISPSFGSMTSNVSFELLTGGNMSYFDSGYVPFIDLYKDGRKRPSLVQELKKNGYDTSIILGGDSYNSSEIMKGIGFTKFSLADKVGHTKGYYISDDYMGDLIIDSLKKNPNKSFVMVETMESHLRYDKNKFNKYDIDVSKSILSKEYQEIMRSYAQGIYDADNMLKKVYDYINNTEEDTIIVFFGDHLPCLQDEEFNNLYDDLQYFNTKSKLVNTYRKYNTEALILSNYELDINFPDYLGYDLLLTYLINHMDIELSSYYKWLYTTSDILPAYNHYVAVDSSGNVNYTSKLSGYEKKIYDLRNKMIYKEFIDK